ncbi:MAG: hypothetical protein ACO3DS_06760, partial [Phycisphaerales bacterium]
MRHVIRATAAVITLACTGSAMAQWCDPEGNPLAGWCGAIANYANLRYAYSRATDRCTAYFSLRWSNLRYCTGEVASDITTQPNLWFIIQLPARACVGSTSVYWNHPDACGLEWPELCPGVFCNRNSAADCSNIYAAPPAQPGTFFVGYDPCPNNPGQNRAVLKTRSLPGGTSSSYSVHVERVVAYSQGPTGELVGSG